MIRRRKPTLSRAVMLTLVVGLVPLLLALWLTYDRELSRAREGLAQAVSRRVTAMDRLLAEAELVLRRLDEETRGKSPVDAAKVMQQAVYRSPAFREAGLVRDGQLVATSLGPVTPPMPLGATQMSRQEVTGLQVVGMVRTKVMETDSLVLAWSTGPKAEVNLLVDPRLLQAAVLGPEELREGAAVVRGPGGEVILESEAGSSQRGSGVWLSERAVSPKYAITHEASVARSWALRRWSDDAWLLTIGGLLTCGVMALLVGEASSRRKGLEEEIKVALAKGEFEPHYQPIMDMATGRCAGAEVLLRWKHPESGYVRPDLFIQTAESSGLIDPIMDQVMARAASDLGPLLASRPDLHIGFNLTPEQFATPGLPMRLLRHFHEGTIRPGQVHLEATERTALESDAVAKVFDELKRLGFGIALDDFGTGYSNLASLSRLSFDVLKIDASFVRRIGQGHVSEGVLEAITHLGATLGVQMVAEGVETAEQHEHLKARGVQMGQGWLYAKAMPAGEFAGFVGLPATSTAGKMRKQEE
ncbi:MAG: EAL domain-containing protein [Phycisphaerales bacterium]